MPQLEQHGWRYYNDASPVNIALNFEAYPWAAFLWAYRHTGEREFLDGTKLKGRHALIVVRGVDYKEDLAHLRSYVREIRPVVIAVDGGAEHSHALDPPGRGA